MPLTQVKRHIRGVRALDKDDYKALIKDSNATYAEDWHEHLRPIHFTPEGARRYRYAPRSTKRVYEGRVRKRKRSGKPMAPNGNPLVWSGRSLERSRTARIVADLTHARAVMPVQALNYRPGGINLRAEFLAVTAQELAVQTRKVKIRQAWFLRNRTKAKTKLIK